MISSKYLVAILLIVILRDGSDKAEAKNDSDEFCGLNYRLTNGGDRIVGGREAEIDEFPWMVSLQSLRLIEYPCNTSATGLIRRANCSITVWTHFCGGALLNSRTILTAAHCSRGLVDSTDPNMGKKIGFRLIAGCHDASVYERDSGSFCQVAEFTRDEFISYPGFAFDNQSIKADIAVIKLMKVQFKFTNKPNGAVGAICLPDPEPRPEGGEMMTVAGWGLMEDGNSTIPERKHLIAMSPKLKSVDLRIMSRETCERYFWKAAKKANFTEMEKSVNMDHELCAYSSMMYNGDCQGDSGGPGLIIFGGRYHVIGVVSAGEKCGRSYFYPNLYTRVDPFLPWITEQMAV